MLSLLNDFLSEGRRLLLNGKCSAWKSIAARRSVSGPLLFLIFINDLPDSIQSTSYLFADDVSLFGPIQNLTSSIETLSDDSTMTNNSSHQWKMCFNPDDNKEAIEIYFTNNKAVGNISQLTSKSNTVYLS